jgi:type IV pilus assembly protein PilE
MKKSKGFTLLELMVVVAIIALLAAISYPIFTSQMRKARRAEARQVLADLALKQEKWRVDHAPYGTCNDLVTNCTTFNTTLSYYTVSVTFPTATGFVLTAAPKGKQTKDTTCGSFVWTVTNGSAAKTPTTAGCW